MRCYLLNIYFSRVALAASVDLLCFAAAALLSWFAIHPASSTLTPWNYTAGVSLGWILCFALLYYADAYSLAALGSGRRTFHTIAITIGLTAAVLSGGYLLLPLSEEEWKLTFQVGGTFFPLLLTGRLGTRKLLCRASFSERVVLLGTSDLARSIARAVRARCNLGTDVAGFLSDEENEQGTWIEGYPVLGKIHQLEKILNREHIDRIVVASKRREEHFPADVLLWAKLNGIKVESGVSFYERITGRVYLRELRPSYFIFSKGFRCSRGWEALKRAFDVAVSMCGLVCAAPVLLLCACAIRLDSKGPVLFAQERVGRGGRNFRVFKLRTMRTDAERETGPVWANPADRRITRVGRLLRKARIDEVPQLWNVLRGDMSLVGPRPERPEFADELGARYPYFRYRCAVRPGITGWAQIRCGYVHDVSQWEDKLALDLYYLKYRSPLMDTLILWNTVKTVVLLRGL